MRGLNLLIILSLAALPPPAQMDRATLTGVVLDPTRSVIPGANISARAVATEIDYTALANSAGVYTLTGLPVGEYTATVSADGFETFQIQNFALEVGETRTLNPTLRLSSVSSNVTVADATPDLNLANAEAGGVITGNQTEELP